MYTVGSAICNDGRNSSAYVEEIGHDMVAYCQIGEESGYPSYGAPTPSGRAEMFYMRRIDRNTAMTHLPTNTSGYVIYHEGGIKAYCVDETDPLNCGYKWVTRGWDSNTWYTDTTMDTFSCDSDCGGDSGKVHFHF